MDCPLNEPQITFRKYQKDVLEQIDLNSKEMHIVAPPGSGKTIIGLELIRRLKTPAVVFAPTTIIAKQWQDKLSFFCNSPQIVSSLKPDKEAFINIFTYQRISTRSEANDAMQKIAREMWKKDLEKTISEEKAEIELQRIEKVNRDNYKKKIAAYISKLRREYDKSVVEKGLHANALELIEKLKDAGVKTIILDECHHLLEYWGLVILYLKDVLGARVIGLTATYPIADEKDVFIDILGEVDYEVSTPAVVKEGYLAPYRELVYFVTPADSEVQLIKSQIKRVENVFGYIKMLDKFQEFCKNIDDSELFKNDYALYEIIIKSRKENYEPNYDEKLIFIRGFLDHAYPIMDGDWQNKVFHMLKSNGLRYTNRSLRITRSVEKYTLSYSEERINGAIKILKNEYEYQGENLRALAITDFDKHIPSKTTNPGKKMGSASNIFLYMTKELDSLDPILVTGTKLYCDDDIAEQLSKEIQQISIEKNLDIKIKVEHRERFAIIRGSGKNWKPSTYTTIITGLFSKGTTKLLIGTKAIFGEGWDSLKLNTLIDLTAISFGTSVQQIRGRTLRLDPEDKTKVSHNWDITCVYPGMFSQIRKLSRKHRLLYGVEDQGNIVKGTEHLGVDLVGIGSNIGPDAGFYMKLNCENKKMFERAKDRDKTLSLWGIGTVYEDNETTTAEVKINKKMIPVTGISWLYGTLKAFFLMIIISAGYYGLTSGDPYVCLGAVTFGFVFTMIVFSLSYVHLLRNPVPEERIVTGISKAVYNTLKKLGVTDDASTLKMSLAGSKGIEIALYGKGNREFADAMNELLSRPINPRYIIQYDITQPIEGLPIIYGLFVRLAENTGIKKQYFAVPPYIAANKERMQIFASQWRMHVGGGKFIYTRSEKGTAILKELAKSSIADWIASISESTYWNYLEGKKNEKSRIIY